jgi:multimeric flavodoxin WrbA
MLVFGLEGSPRKKGNTRFLLSAFMAEAEKRGAETQVVHAHDMPVSPCIECGVCEKKGVCSIDDKMQKEIYPLLRRAEVVVLASPIFFYNITAQLKAPVDRSQTLWSCRYRLKLNDPLYKTRKGLLLSVGATKGKSLFEGTHLTARYFFDAISAKYAGGLTYWQIEGPDDMEKHPTFRQEIEEMADGLLNPLVKRKKVLFAGRENRCGSQMAAAFAQYHAGDRIEALTAGSVPAEKVLPAMQEAMAEKGVDMGFRFPRSIEAVVSHDKPDVVVAMGCGDPCGGAAAATRIDWELPDPKDGGIDAVRSFRDDIEKKVLDLVDSLGNAS